MPEYRGRERRARPPVSAGHLNWAAIAVIVPLVGSAFLGFRAYGQTETKIVENARSIDRLQENIDRLQEQVDREHQEVGTTIRRIDNRLTEQHGVLSAQTEAIKNLTEEIRSYRGRDGKH